MKSKINTIQSWITKHAVFDFTIRDVKEMPELDEDDINKLGELNNSLTTISETNKKINQNNEYSSFKSMLINRNWDMFESDNDGGNT
mgnify:CR=1 FL=1